MIIYKITNVINGKIYVGKTTLLLSTRWKCHLNCVKSGKSRMAIHRAIRFYGREKFTIEEIAWASSFEEMNKLEEFYIRALHALAPEGYNLAFGGYGPGKFSDEAKRNVSVAGIGRKHSEETKEKIARAHFGKTIPGEVRLKIAGSLTGRKLSEETKDKISRSQIGKKKIRHKVRVRCSRGHELTDENVYVYGNSRCCKTCARENSRSQYKQYLVRIGKLVVSSAAP